MCMSQMCKCMKNDLSGGATLQTKYKIHMNMFLVYTKIYIYISRYTDNGM